MQLLPDLSNTEAVARLRAGDQEVFTRLYQTCYRMVYLQAMKILGRADQAEQVVQDVFIAVFRSIDKLKDPETLRSWIGGIAVRLALHQRQKLTDSHEFTLEEEAMLDLLDSGPPVSSPEDTLCERDTGLILGELVDQLPDEQRTAVMLYYYDQCPVRQIASILQCAEGTVKSRLNYARKALEKLILKREQRDGIRLHALNPGLLFLALFLQEQNLPVDQQTMERGLWPPAAVSGWPPGPSRNRSQASRLWRWSRPPRRRRPALFLPHRPPRAPRRRPPRRRRLLPRPRRRPARHPPPPPVPRPRPRRPPRLPLRQRPDLPPHLRPPR